MPLYEYKCAACGEVFELIQKFADEPLKVHETCGGAVDRLLSPPAFRFKGSGWYVTDYARPSNGKGESQEASRERPAKAAAEAAEKAAGKKSEGSPSSPPK